MQTETNCHSPTVSSLKILVKVTGIKTLLDADSEIFVSGANERTVSRRVPAESFALFFGDFLDHGECLRPTILADSREDGIHQGNGSGVRGAEGSCFDRSQENFVTFARQGRNIGVRDTDAISASNARLLCTVDGLSKSAAEADRNY